MTKHSEKVICRTALPFAVMALCCGMSGTDAAAAVCGPGRSLPASTWLMTAPSCNPSPADLVSQYGGDIPSSSYGTNWIAYKWSPAGQSYGSAQAETDALVLGTGNWLYSLNAGTLFLDGTATPTAPCANYGDTDLVGNCFAIDLETAPDSSTDIWQMVGNPFPYTVDWRNVRIASSSDGTNWNQHTPSEAAAPAVNLMAKEFWQYGSGYETKDDVTLGSIGALRPQESVWVRIKSGSSGLSGFKLLIPMRELNDTGITWGGSYPSGNNADCTGETIGAQDCSNGPDDADMTGNTDSDGLAGFSYTKLDSSGQPLADQAADYATTPWACVQDNVTGLIWEVKTADGLHSKTDTYTWYNTDANTNGGAAGVDGAANNTCSGYSSGDSTTYCNTQAYVSRVNTAGLCGFNDWRMPTPKELKSLVNYGRSNPAIDRGYFPNAVVSYVWSGSPVAADSGGAWLINISFGDSVVVSRFNGYAVRLVRGGN